MTQTKPTLAVPSPSPGSAATPNRPAAPPEESTSTSSAEQRGRNPIPFAVLFFGAPLLVILVLEWLRLHG